MEDIKIFNGCDHPLKHIKNDNVFIVLTQEEKNELLNSTGQGSLNVDFILNSTSSNPVANKVIYLKLVELDNKIKSIEQRLNNISDLPDDYYESEKMNLRGFYDNEILTLSHGIYNKETKTLTI